MAPSPRAREWNTVCLGRFSVASGNDYYYCRHPDLTRYLVSVCGLVTFDSMSRRHHPNIIYSCSWLPRIVSDVVYIFV